MKSKPTLSWNLFRTVLFIAILLIVVLSLYRISLLFTTDWAGVFSNMTPSDYVLSLVLVSLLCLLRYRPG